MEAPKPRTKQGTPENGTEESSPSTIDPHAMADDTDEDIRKMEEMALMLERLTQNMLHRTHTLPDDSTTARSSATRAGHITGRTHATIPDSLPIESGDDDVDDENPDATECDQKLRDFSTRLETVGQQMGQLHLNLLRTKEAEAEADIALASARAQVTHLKKALAEEHESLHILSTAAKSTDSELRSQLAAVLERAALSEQEKIQLKTQLSAAEATTDHLREELDTANNRVADLLLELATTQGNLNHALERADSETASNASGLPSSARGVRNELDRVTEQLRAAQVSNKEMSRKHKTTADQYRAAQERAAELENRVRDTDAICQRLASELEITRQTARGTIEEVNRLRRVIKESEAEDSTQESLQWWDIRRLFWTLAGQDTNQKKRRSHRSRRISKGNPVKSFLVGTGVACALGLAYISFAHSNSKPKHTAPTSAAALYGPPTTLCPNCCQGFH